MGWRFCKIVKYCITLTQMEIPTWTTKKIKGKCPVYVFHWHFEPSACFGTFWSLLFNFLNYLFGSGSLHFPKARVESCYAATTLALYIKNIPDWPTLFRLHWGRPIREVAYTLTYILTYIFPDEELFSETAVGCTASYFVKIIWCSRWFCKPPPKFWGCVLLYLRSPKGGCCSISDDLSCSHELLKLI